MTDNLFIEIDDGSGYPCAINIKTITKIYCCHQTGNTYLQLRDHLSSILIYEKYEDFIGRLGMNIENGRRL